MFKGTPGSLLKITHGSALEIIWDIKDQTRVSHVQGKPFTHYGIAVAARNILGCDPKLIQNKTKKNKMFP